VSIKKQYLKKKSVCKVAFTVPKQLAAFASTVHLVGDFNYSNKSITPIKRFKNGQFTSTLFLRQDAEYEFRFLLDGLTWENDPQADRYVQNVYGTENSVVIV